MVKSRKGRGPPDIRFKIPSRKKMTRSKVEKIAHKVLNSQSEFKRRLDYQPTTAITNITAGHLLFDGPQVVSGTGSEERSGLKVMLKHLKFKLSFAYLGIPTQVRLIGVRYPQGSSSPSLADVLTHAVTNAQISPWVKDGPIRYSIWYNKIIKLGGDSQMTSTYKNKVVSFSAKLGKHGTQLTFESGSTQSPDKNRYVLFAVPNVMPALTADRPTCEAFISTGFTDL